MFRGAGLPLALVRGRCRVEKLRCDLLLHAHARTSPQKEGRAGEMTQITGALGVWPYVPEEVLL